MSVLNLHNIEKSYVLNNVLKGFSLNVNKGERLGLIGANGSGKTTIFKIISRLEPYNSGTLTLQKDLKLGYLEQIPIFSTKNTVYKELKRVFSDLVKMEKELRETETKIANESKEKKEKLNKLLDEYSQLQHLFELSEGYQYESKIRKIALGMGFTLEELDKRLEVLSGGEKTRLGLVKLLLSEPDLLLLDEPTNHLDLAAIQWLEDYLREYQGTVIIISHDRYFLDQVVTRIVEISNGKEEVFQGNYSYYLKEREVRYEQKLKNYENQQKKINKLEEAIDRLQRWGKQGDNEKFFKQAKSMEKALAKMEKVEKPILNGRKMKLNLAINQRSGNEVLKVSDITKSFAQKKLLNNVDLNLYWGEKAAIIGKNGTGKTSLIKIILGELDPEQGEIKIGVNVKIAYYSQQFEGFNPQDDLVEALCGETSMNTKQARNALAAFLFTEDDVFNPVSSLSGGEKSRLRLLQLMHGDYNFLIMDEPTNHLDLASREVLEQALEEYRGTVLVVSHDRYFLNKLIDYTYELENGSLTKYYGNYDYYRQKKKVLTKDEKEENINNNNGKKPKQISDYHRLKEKSRKEKKQKKQLEELEKRIEELELAKKELEAEMIKPDNLEKFSLLQNLKQKYEEINKKLNQLYANWEEYVENVEI